jgi:hypothetical protein
MYSCSEQISSRILSIVALQDVLEAFNSPDLPSKKKLKSNVSSGLLKLKKMQYSNGSFGWWNNDKRYEPSLFGSIHVIHCLVRTKEQGYDVDQDMYQKSIRFITSIENYFKANWTQSTKNFLIASSIYVYALMSKLSDGLNFKKSMLKKARNLIAQHGETLNMESFAWATFGIFILGSGNDEPEVQQLLKKFHDNVNETAKTANFITTYTDNNEAKLILLHSNRRTDGILLEILIHTSPQNPLIPKMVKGLLSHQTKGRWGNTQVNIYILLALKKYFQVYEKTTPDFIAKTWLGPNYIGQTPFKGRTTSTKEINIPMSHISKTKTSLILQKQGQGRMYYRLGISYALKNMTVKSLDHGFIVERTFEGVTNPKHARLESGVWCFAAGELIRVRLVVSNSSRRYHVAVVDKLPAGVEIVNPELKTSGPLPKDTEKKSGRFFWWNPRWYQHENLRDERAEVFTTLLYAGVHKYSYITRATTLGEFIVPPATAEEMYSPEVFGRTKTERVIVAYHKE